MGLGSMGYTLKSSHTDAEGHLIRRFTNPDPQTTPLVDVIFKDYMPICVIYMSADESVRGRVYLSDYKNFGRISLPCRQTEVVYTSPKDSIVSRSIYSGIEIDSLDPLFDFEIPASAKPLTLKQNSKK